MLYKPETINELREYLSELHRILDELESDSLKFWNSIPEYAQETITDARSMLMYLDTSRLTARLAAANEVAEGLRVALDALYDVNPTLETTSDTTLELFADQGMLTAAAVLKGRRALDDYHEAREVE